MKIREALIYKGGPLPHRVYFCQISDKSPVALELHSVAALKTAQQVL